MSMQMIEHIVFYISTDGLGPTSPFVIEFSTVKVSLISYGASLNFPNQNFLLQLNFHLFYHTKMAGVFLGSLSNDNFFLNDNHLLVIC